MAAGYQGYAGYGDPEKKKLDRQRSIADTLRDRALETGPKTLAEGISQIGQALIARQAGKKADKAEAAFADKKSAIADTFLSQMFPDDPGAVAAADAAAPAPYDLTPAGDQKRAAVGGLGGQVKSLAALTGDPMMAMQFGQGERARMQADSRYTDEQAYSRGRDAKGDQRLDEQFDFTKDRARVGDEQWGKTFDQRGDEFDETMAFNRTKDANDLARAQAKAGDEAFGPNGLSKDKIQLEREFAKDWSKVQTNYSDISSQFQRMQAMANRADSAGDLALVVSFTKMLDPGSVAREGEVALTQKAASALDQVQNWLPRLEKGETLLPPEVRRQLLEAGGEMNQVYKGAYDKLGANYYSTAETYGFAPDRVMMGFEAPKKPTVDDFQIPPVVSRVSDMVSSMFKNGQPAAAAPAPAPLPSSAAVPGKPNGVTPEIKKAAKTGQTMRNPETGEVIAYNPTTRQWERVK